MIVTMTDAYISQLTESERNRIMNIQDDSVFGKNLWNYYQFISWARFYPDLFVEIFKSKDSNRQLHFDQRVFMRCDLRFMSMYGTFSRGYAKTYTEVLDDFIRLYDKTPINIRAVPRGIAGHWISGNTLIIGQISLLRTILTKNANIIKVSSKNKIFF